MDSAPLLEFRDVQKHYRTGTEVVRAVDGLSLAVEAGEMVALYGPSGSGKSTILRIGAGIETPDSGAVYVEGEAVSGLSGKAAAHYRMHVLGWINQESDLLDGATALDNAATKVVVTAGSWRRARRSVVPLLEELGLGHRLEHRAETLSMGERQRVMIARALSLNPRVLLADEPTGSLDSRRSREVLALLQEATHSRAMATVLVTHDEHAVAYADTVYTLQDGVLHDSGPDAAPAPWA
ncbi:MAG TPA: ABC transporter ATP-binding protein [Baekduia sp.]|uniref:ABC transporter ATP-binding protein n=1 Tax=Baekduia sp. TaxID=2600305 RepID=UPI002B87DAF8|nr:ABC transporter ATP-binding protein [Baekduia sp.]HMJ36267.1 ABC transporter ATP-binding protein [Baekduia sp.]